MRLRINGEDKDVADGITIAGLVDSLGLGGRRVAVERNREVVPASGWNSACLADNDVVEIVHFVGGG
ncbi:MAG TPA: sulfur carrier protein ThiS [Candidatus Limnocylindrales bacterium]|nr:sulfur carrier protein ThiS [Candidatus Limnocylindrales bacterium]